VNALVIGADERNIVLGLQALKNQVSDVEARIDQKIREDTGAFNSAVKRGDRKAAEQAAQEAEELAKARLEARHSELNLCILCFPWSSCPVPQKEIAPSALEMIGLRQCAAAFSSRTKSRTFHNMLCQDLAHVIQLDKGQLLLINVAAQVETFSPPFTHSLLCLPCLVHRMHSCRQAPVAMQVEKKAAEVSAALQKQELLEQARIQEKEQQLAKAAGEARAKLAKEAAATQQAANEKRAQELASSKQAAVEKAATGAKASATPGSAVQEALPVRMRVLYLMQTCVLICTFVCLFFSSYHLFHFA
jgi:hypothetical protein